MCKSKQAEFEACSLQLFVLRFAENMQGCPVFTELQLTHSLSGKGHLLLSSSPSLEVSTPPQTL